jgi:hypothetical protein
MPRPARKCPALRRKGMCGREIPWRKLACHDCFMKLPTEARAKLNDAYSRKALGIITPKQLQEVIANCVELLANPKAQQ